MMMQSAGNQRKREDHLENGEAEDASTNDVGEMTVIRNQDGDIITEH